MVDKIVPREKIGMHMHDTHQKAHLNIVEGLKLGIQHLIVQLVVVVFAPGALGTYQPKNYYIRSEHASMINTNMAWTTMLFEKHKST